VKETGNSKKAIQSHIKKPVKGIDETKEINQTTINKQTKTNKNTNNKETIQAHLSKQLKSIA